MRCKMQKLTNESKEKLYEQLGFQFEMHNEENSYDNIFKAIGVGGIVTDLCIVFDLDDSLVVEYIKKYILQLILEESINFVCSEKDLLRAFSDEPLLDTTIGEILEEILNEVDFTLSEKFTQYFIDTLKKTDDKFNGENIRFNEQNKSDKERMPVSVYPFSERTNTLYPLYFRYYVNKIRSIKPRYWDKDTVPENIVSDLLIHYKQFMGLLIGFENNINPTRDIIELERNTDIFFLLKLASVLPVEKLKDFSKKKRRNYLIALSSITLIEDIRLKLYFAEELIFSSNEDMLLRSHGGYSLLYKLNFLVIPLLKIFIKEKIKIPYGTLTVRSLEADKEEGRRLKNIKKSLYIYKVLHHPYCYEVPDLNVSLDEINYSNSFFELYKKVNKIRGYREELSWEVIESCFQCIIRKPEFLYEYIEYEAMDFMFSGKKLALDK